MTPSEFKAWFDGFTEAMQGLPNEDQWKKIRKRVSEIDGTPITERIYIDHWPGRYWGTYQASYSVAGDTSPRFDSRAAMLLAGKSEYLAAEN